MANLSARAEALTSQVAEKAQSVQALTVQLAERNDQVQALTVQLAERNDQVQALTVQLAERNDQVQALTVQLAERNDQVQALTVQLAERNDQVQALTVQLAERNDQVQALTVQLAERNDQVQALTVQLAERNGQLQAITSTRAWRAALWLQRIRAALLPRGSLRARIARKLLSFLLNPFIIRRSYKMRGDLALIRKSGLFDREWYLVHNPDVAQAGVDPAQHYLVFGGFEGRILARNLVVPGTWQPTKMLSRLGSIHFSTT